MGIPRAEGGLVGVDGSEFVGSWPELRNSFLSAPLGRNLNIFLRKSGSWAQLVGRVAERGVEPVL